MTGSLYHTAEIVTALYTNSNFFFFNGKKSIGKKRLFHMQK